MTPASMASWESVIYTKKLRFEKHYYTRRGETEKTGIKERYPSYLPYSVILLRAVVLADEIDRSLRYSRKEDVLEAVDALRCRRS